MAPKREAVIRYFRTEYHFTDSRCSCVDFSISLATSRDTSRVFLNAMIASARTAVFGRLYDVGCCISSSVSCRHSGSKRREIHKCSLFSSCKTSGSRCEVVPLNSGGLGSKSSTFLFFSLCIVMLHKGGFSNT